MTTVLYETIAYSPNASTQGVSISTEQVEFPSERVAERFIESIINEENLGDVKVYRRAKLLPG